MMRALLLMCLVLLPVLVQAELQVDALKVAVGPQVDGDNSDAVWQQAKPVMINDQASREALLLSAVYTDERIYFLVQYPDKAENPLHKPWMWDAAAERYVEGSHREDTFVFKWSMMAQDVNLSNFSDADYRADVWYWKANRSNLSGYADDKMQILAGTKQQVQAGQEEEGSLALKSSSGKVRYLSRVADQGEPPYKKVAAPEVKGAPVVNRFSPAVPSGSRGDVEAKGHWVGGFWVIEFSRKLQTGHADDIQFSLEQSPLFGVSIFSLYGRDLDAGSPNLYGMGRLSEPLRLNFLK